MKAVRYLQGPNGAAMEDILLRCPNQLDSETVTKRYLDNAVDRGILNLLSNGRYAVNKSARRQKSSSSSRKKPSGTRRPRSKTPKGSGGRRSSSKTKKRSSSKRQKGRKSPKGSPGRTKRRSSSKSEVKRKSPAGKKTESKSNSRRRSKSVETQTPEFVEVKRHVVECLACGDLHVCHKQNEASSDQKKKKK